MTCSVGGTKSLGGAPPEVLSSPLTKAFCLALLAVLAVGCVHDPALSCSPSAPASRIIVKFVNVARAAPKNIQVRTRHGAAALRHERAMSGDADLYRTCAAEKRLAVIIHALNQRPDVKYAEADRRLGY